MTFLKSMRKGLLKNVQDGISRPLGSREITKSKGEVFFTHPLGEISSDGYCAPKTVDIMKYHPYDDLK